MPATPQPRASRHVAVIGAGAAGLVAGRELRRAGHNVVIFEKNNQIGGTWVYTTRVESGHDPAREIVHSSMYKSLRTNLPREAMGFLDYPFVAREGKIGDPRRFPGHEEVLKYLREFASEFGVEEMVRFEAEVMSVELSGDGKWKVESKRKGIHGDDGGDIEVFDAVVVCNGHHTEPRFPQISGLDLWPGKQIHSHNYRDPEPFRDQVKDANEDGTVVFNDGSVVTADIILHCTGYKYHFPFLKTNGIVTVEDNRVGPLYKHVFPPVLAPCLSFVGIQWKIAPFPMFELQSKWIAAVLSGQIALPLKEDMMEVVNTFYSTLEASGIPIRYTHNMFDSMLEYSNWLATQCLCPGFEEWRLQMYYGNAKNRAARPTTFRDDWEDFDLVMQAYEDFSKYTSSRAGIDLWPGKQIHSHNYRNPEPFRDQVVILIGSSFSAADISIEIAGVAKEVHISSRSISNDTYEKKPGFDNIWLHSEIEGVKEDGTVVFQDGSVITADIILHCTGYKYDFPFLKTNGIVTVDDNRVGPLYKHVFPPVLAPWLSFVGIIFKSIPLPMFELQSKWIAAVLSGQIALPSPEDMMEDVNTFYSTLEASGIPKHYTHSVYNHTLEYSSWLAAQSLCQGFEEWRLQMRYETAKNMVTRPTTFRDNWEDFNPIMQAYEDFSKYTSSRAGNGSISK